jgi:hypothetical protein
VYRVLSLVALAGFVALDAAAAMADPIAAHPVAVAGAVQPSVAHDSVAQTNTVTSSHARTAARIPGTFAITMPATSAQDPLLELQNELRVLMPARAGDA